MKRILHLIGIVAVGAFLPPAASVLRAGEIAVLRTGLRLHADRHEVEGARLRLFSGDGGVTELPVASVLRFEDG